MEKVFHIHCGDCSAELAGRSGLPGETIVWCDLLHEGPLPNVPFEGDEWRLARAGILSASTGGAISPERCLKRLESQDAALEGAWGGGGEIILWFDACLYDQAILARHLKWLSSKDSVSGRASIVCIDSFSGIARFTGLGELSPGDFIPLYESRTGAGGAEIKAGAEAWDALASPSPESILRLALDGVPPLPFMGDALMRHLRQYPSFANGLPLLEEEALAALASDGAQTPVSLFKKVSEMEERPHFGDSTFWRRLNALASCESPLIRIEGPSQSLPVWFSEGSPRLDSWSVSITGAGEKVLEGSLDHVALNGVSLSVGGLFFEGRECLRFDHEALAFKRK